MQNTTDSFTDLIEVDLERTKFKILTAIVRLFGKTREIDFYKRRYKEMLNLYSLEEQQGLNLISENITDETLTQIEIIYPTNDFALWEELQKTLSDKYFDDINIVAILQKISKYDIRISVAFFLVLGFLQSQTIGEFQKTFEVSSTFILDYSASGIRNLLEDLLLDNIGAITPSQIRKVVEFLESLQDFNNNRLLRYADGRLISSDSIFYTLAKILISNKKLDLSKLSSTQRKVIEIFTKDLDATERFTSYYLIAEQLNITSVSIHKHVIDILDKLSSNKDYIRTKAGKIVEIDKDSPQGELVSKYNDNPELLSNANLNTTHLRYISAFLNSRDSDGIYASLASIAETLGVSPANFTYVIQDALERLNTAEDDLYLDKDGGKIASNEARLKLLRKTEEDPAFLLRLEDDKISLVNLLLSRTGNRFHYTYSEIATKLGIKARHPDKAITLQVFRIIDSNLGSETRYIDERNRPIIKSYQTLLRIATTSGIPDKLWKLISAKDSQVLRRLLQTDNIGRYGSYEQIATEFSCKSHNIRDVVTRVLKQLEKILEA